VTSHCNLTREIRVVTQCRHSYSVKLYMIYFCEIRCVHYATGDLNVLVFFNISHEHGGSQNFEWDLHLSVYDADVMWWSFKSV
jgi:hypothetical protein